MNTEPTSMVAIFEGEAVGVNFAVTGTLPRWLGRQVHVAVIDELDTVERDLHPGIIFPFAKNETFPASETVTDRVVAVL
jgi:hypothetical protein